jgi:hypothetical protein
VKGEAAGDTERTRSGLSGTGSLLSAFASPIVLVALLAGFHVLFVRSAALSAAFVLPTAFLPPVIVLVALFTSLHMLFVASTLVWHKFLPIKGRLAVRGANWLFDRSFPRKH